MGKTYITSGIKKEFQHFPYEIHVVGDSLSSWRTGWVLVELELAWTPKWLEGYVFKNKTNLPYPNRYVNNRFNDGENIIDYLCHQLPSLHIPQRRNYAFLGAATDTNFVNDQATEEASQKFNEYKNDGAFWGLLRSYKITTSANIPSLSDQWNQLIKNVNRTKSGENQRERAVLYWGKHNDLLSLPYYAGFGKRWATLSNITEPMFYQLKDTLNKTIKHGSQKLASNIIKTAKKTNINKFFVYEVAHIERSPLFYRVTNDFKHLDGFESFIATMNDRYNHAMKEAIDKALRKYKQMLPNLEIHILKTPETGCLPDAYVKRGFIDENGIKKDGKMVDINNLSKKDKKAMQNAFFHDHLHLSRRAIKLAFGPQLIREMRRVDPKLDYFLHYRSPHLSDLPTISDLKKKATLLKTTTPHSIRNAALQGQ